MISNRVPSRVDLDKLSWWCFLTIKHTVPAIDHLTFITDILSAHSNVIIITNTVFYVYQIL